MGRGDKRTKKGKIAAKSFGKTRMKKKNKKAAGAATNNKTENKENA